MDDVREGAIVNTGMLLMTVIFNLAVGAIVYWSFLESYDFVSSGFPQDQQYVAWAVTAAISLGGTVAFLFAARKTGGLRTRSGQAIYGAGIVANLIDIMTNVDSIANNAAASNSLALTIFLYAIAIGAGGAEELMAYLTGLCFDLYGTVLEAQGKTPPAWFRLATEAGRQASGAQAANQIQNMARGQRSR